MERTEEPSENDAKDDGELDTSELDFDPADGYLTGTALDGTTEIPGPHAYGTPDVETT
ncbi:hypothetical protein [Jatrophihabitans sp.]|uniref:hypothetical protein n=1 Tax=Jatrophihabitans sp. TaxID=1932789 RepID=UPI0030C6B7E7|nr:hypothetical protein [Jatrophihabitans sp.]